MDGRQLRCPACDGTMQQADRRGVVIDICRECKGVFLDRGELDRLLDAAPESGWSEPAPRRYDDDDRWRAHDPRASGGYQRKKKKNFLEDIFDF